jgi:hypothetical protein
MDRSRDGAHAWFALARLGEVGSLVPDQQGDYRACRRMLRAAAECGRLDEAVAILDSQQRATVAAAFVDGGEADLAAALTSQP